MENNTTTYMIHRFSVREGYVDKYLDIWYREAELRKQHGFEILFANIDDLFNMISWGYSYDGDVDAAEKRFNEDPARIAIAQESKPYVYTNDSIRRVKLDLPIVKSTPESIKCPTLYRRYVIKPGGWDKFFEYFHQVVPMREKYGFKVLYGFADPEESIYTWSFYWDGDLDEMQKPYYKDPERIKMNENYNYLTDVSLKMVRQLLVP